MSNTLQECYKVKETDFTRDRKQTFSSTLLFMLNFLRKSLAIEIENFVSFMKKDCGMSNIKTFTKSAFVQCRKKINADVFKHLSSILIDEFYTDNEDGIKLWKEFRLLGVDGSRLTMPDTEELRHIFGEARNQTKSSIVQARVSILYDVLNNYVLDGVLSSLLVGEITLAYQHLNYCTTKDLVIYDRGYPSYDFIHEHNKKGINYLFRVKVGFSNVTKAFLQSGKTSQTIEIYPGKNAKLLGKEYYKDTAIKVRLIQFKLPSGEIELLMTSLLSRTTYSNNIFKELYFKRWGIETFYGELKNKLKVEYFSGYSYQSIMQDFYAALFISNVQTLIVTDINDDIAVTHKNCKYQYKVNTNISYGFLKNRILSLFFSNIDMQDILKELNDLYRKNVIPIRPERSFSRNKDKYRKRERPKVTKNQRDAI